MALEEQSAGLGKLGARMEVRLDGLRHVRRRLGRQVRAAIQREGDDPPHLRPVRPAEIGYFLAVQEDIFLRLINIVDESGTGFAFPPTVNYLARDGGIDAERTERTERTEAIMRGLRDGKALPLPDFDVEMREKIRDTLDYPPEGSIETVGRGGANCHSSIRDPGPMKYLSTAVAPRNE